MRPSRSREGSTDSSRNTGRPPAEVPLWVYLACEDNPKACTGRRALHRGLAREAGQGAGPSRHAVLLDPHAPAPLTHLDRETAVSHGLLAIDCSWNRLGERGGYPGEGWLSRFENRRRLPLLLAANPQHYGRVSELNTAEALGASVYVLEGKDAAQRFFQGFSFGDSFLSLNGVLLEEYHRAKTREAVAEIEHAYLAGSA